MRGKPVVLVPACSRQLGDHPFKIAGRKYLEAVRLAGCQPLIVPWAEDGDVDALLDLADGVLLSGSPSNVHPSNFDQAVHDPALPLDPERDDWTLPLIRRALARGIPVLGICRGAQEMNVALGGTLHQAVHETAGRSDHRADDTRPVEVQYGPSHEVRLVPGGVLAGLLPEQFTVNSIHGQAVDRLATGLRVEATSPDGVIEAFSAPACPGFALAVQWHPEWRAADNPQSIAMLQAFGRACADRRERGGTAAP